MTNASITMVDKFITIMYRSSIIWAGSENSSLYRQLAFSKEVFSDRLHCNSEPWEYPEFKTNVGRICFVSICSHYELVDQGALKTLHLGSRARHKKLNLRARISIYSSSLTDVFQPSLRFSNNIKAPSKTILKRELSWVFYSIPSSVGGSHTRCTT